MPIDPITGDYQAGKGRAYFTKSGETRMEEIGDVDDFIVSLEVERLERLSNQYGTRKKTDSRVIQTTATLSFTAMQMTARNTAIVFGSEKTFLSQPSASSQSYVHNGVKAGDMFNLGYRDVTVVSVQGDGTPTGAYSTGNYDYDSAVGALQINSIPTAAAAMTGVTIVFDVAQVTGSVGRLHIGGGSSPDLEGKITFITYDANNNPIEMVEVHRVKLAPNGDINFISDEYRSLPIQGEIISDTTQADGFELFTFTDLTPRTNRGVADA